MRISLTKEFLSGALFVFIGLGTIVIAQNYHLGSASDMGPAYFPIILGAITTFIGGVMLIRSVVAPDNSEPVPSWEVRPLIFVLAGILLFSALIDTYGVIAAVIAVVLVSRIGASEGTMPELVLITVVMVALALGIFVYGLNIPLRLRP